MEQKIITSRSASGLNKKIEEHITEGFEPVGSHKVITTHIEVQRVGTQHVHTTEYSQTMKKV